MSLADADLDHHFPPSGPCGICGDADARHRLWDAILDRLRAGESRASVAADFGLSADAVEAVERTWV